MLEINVVQGFCPLKIKITQFPDGFCLKILLCLRGCPDTFHIFSVFFVLKSLLGLRDRVVQNLQFCP